MSEWRRVLLGDLLTRITYGFTNPMPTTSSGPYMVTAKDIQGGKINYQTARSTSKQAYLERLTDKSRPRKGDVLLTKDGSIGRVALCDRSDVCINQSVALLQLNDLADAKFLVYLLQAPLYQQRMAADADGSTIKHIYITRVDKMAVDLPSKEEQRAIAEVLGALDDKIAANDALAGTADHLASALTQQSFGSGSVPLADLAEVTMGSSPPGESYNELGDGTPFYQGVRDFGFRSPTRRVWTTAPVRFADAGDVLLSVRAPVGRTNLARERVCLGRGLAGLRSRSGRSATLFHQVRAAKDAWAPYEAEGTVFGAINKGQLESIELPGIDPAKGDMLEDQLAAIEARIAAAADESVALAGTRDELLPLLMSGRIRVKDAEKTAEEVL